VFATQPEGVQSDVLEGDSIAWQPASYAARTSEMPLH